jgi:hypothetical protein
LTLVEMLRRLEMLRPMVRWTVHPGTRWFDVSALSLAALSQLTSLCRLRLRLANPLADWLRGWHRLGCTDHPMKITAQRAEPPLSNVNPYRALTIPDFPIYGKYWKW